jgi:hypothetical protein
MQVADAEYYDFMLGTPEAHGLGVASQMGPAAAADAKLNVRFYEKSREAVMCSDCAAAQRAPAPQGLDGLLLAAQMQLPQAPKVAPRTPGEGCCSTNAGRPIYKGVVYVSIRNPGDKDTIVDREARVDPKKLLPDGGPGDVDARRFPRQWAAFRSKRDQATAAGTPLMVLVHVTPPILTADQVEEMRHLPGSPIHTVEQLAGLPDTVCDGFRGFKALRDRASEYLARTRAEAPLAMVQAMREQERQRAEQLEAALAQQGERMKQQDMQIQALMDEVRSMGARAAPSVPPAATPFTTEPVQAALMAEPAGGPVIAVVDKPSKGGKGGAR